VYQNFIIPYLYEAQRVSGDTQPIIRSLKLHWQPLVFHTWKVVWTCSWWTLSGTHCAWQRPPTTRPTTFHVWKIRGCQCSFGLLVVGGVSPETCWASYKYGIITFWYNVASCWIFIYDMCICWFYYVSLTFWNLQVTWCTNKFNIQQLYALPTMYLCVLYLSENKQLLLPLTA
jgi:hypothetical protein